MVNVAGIVQQLKSERDRLTRQIQGISAALSAFEAAYTRGPGTRTMSEAARTRISSAQKARWKRVKDNGGQSAKPHSIPKKRTMSAESREKIAAAQRTRWAKV